MPTTSNYGGAGLIDMRTARFLPDGYLSVSTSFSSPDDRYALTFQALPWAEFTFRYAINRGIPDANLALHDRSFDLKFRLSHETEDLPELAVGVQDFLGTGFYSGEYFVGTKRWGAFDFTLGLGWGRLGSRGTFTNPFILLGKGFKTRPASKAFGGVPLVGAYFRGPDMSPFGGVEYTTPFPKLKIKVEYSSDIYKTESLMTGRKLDFPIDIGLNYRPFPWLDIGLSLMHGKTIGLKIATLIDAKAQVWPSRLDPPPRWHSSSEQSEGPSSSAGPAEARASAGTPPTRFVDLTRQRPAPPETPQSVPVPTPRGDEAPPAPQYVPVPAAPEGSPLSLPDASPALRLPPSPPAAIPADAGPSPAADLAAIKTALERQNLVVMDMEIIGDTIAIHIENRLYRRDAEAIARAARVLSALAPANLHDFEITTVRLGQPITTATLPRSEIDKLAENAGSPVELWYSSILKPAADQFIAHALYPRFGADLYPVFRQSLFDPDNPVYVQFGVGGSAGIELTRGLFISGSVLASAYDDFNRIRRTSDSVLPHVRSDFAQYLKKGKYGMETLNMAYYFKLAPEIFGRFNAGYLEQMFAGAGGELLYRPFGRRWALGANLWFVRQRGFDELLDLKHYQAFTGHLSVYYHSPWHDVIFAAHAGQYLAGDKGVTFEVSRRFLTGVEIGAFFTLTNVSTQQFGEGSFDKGIRVVIPMEWAAPFPSQGGYALELRPIQRDGGQRLGGDTLLYGITEPSDYGAISEQWNSVFGR